MRRVGNSGPRACIAGSRCCLPRTRLFRSARVKGILNTGSFGVGVVRGLAPLSDAVLVASVIIYLDLDPVSMCSTRQHSPPDRRHNNRMKGGHGIYDGRWEPLALFRLSDAGSVHCYDCRTLEPFVRTSLIHCCETSTRVRSVPLWQFILRSRQFSFPDFYVAQRGVADFGYI